MTEQLGPIIGNAFVVHTMKGYWEMILTHESGWRTVCRMDGPDDLFADPGEPILSTARVCFSPQHPTGQDPPTFTNDDWANLYKAWIANNDLDDSVKGVSVAKY